MGEEHESVYHFDYPHATAAVPIPPVRVGVGMK